MTVGPIGGVLTFTINGRRYLVRGELTIQPLETKREEVAGSDGFHGYNYTGMVPYIEAQVSTDSTFDLEALYNLPPTTIRAELYNGSVYILDSAQMTGETAIQATEGTCTVRFTGPTCRRVSNGGANP